MKNKLILALKIIIASLSAILIARFLKLDFAVSTGVIAILTIQPTKRETIKTAFARFLAFLIALLVAGIAFGVMGINWGAFFAYLIVFILCCCITGWSGLIAPCAVLIAHFISIGKFDVHSVINEVLIFVIGSGVGVIANLHLKKRTAYMNELSKATDEQIKKIISRMSERIMNSEIKDYDGSCFKELDSRIFEAKRLALENYNNQFDKNDIYDMEYIDMRNAQRQLLFEMYKNASTLSGSPSTAKRVSEYLKNMALVFDEENDGKKLLEEFYEMHSYMKSQPLPVTREEFEDRARLYILMENIGDFIKIKMEFFEKFHLNNSDCS